MNLHKSIAVAKAGTENTRKDGYTRCDSRNSINAAVDLKEDLTDDLSSLNIFRKKIHTNDQLYCGLERRWLQTQ